MEVQFSQELESKLNRVAAENQRATGEYVNQLVESYLEHDIWFRAQVRKGLDQLDRGEFITHEEMSERIERMFRP